MTKEELNKEIIAFLKEQQKEYRYGCDAYNVLRKLETYIPNIVNESQLKPQEGEWTKNKPTEKGLYFRSNPAFQKDITQQDVYLVDGELKTHHPLNEGSKLINAKDMPSAFLWIKMPYPPHYKRGNHQ